LLQVTREVSARKMDKALAEAGADVAIVFLKEFERAQQTVEEPKRLNVNSMAIKADVTKLEEAREMIIKVANEWRK